MFENEPNPSEIPKAARKADGVLRRFELIAAFGGNVCMLAILFIVFSDVIMRYFFNAPLVWAYDIVSRYLLVAVFFAFAAPTLRTEEHIRVLFFRPFLPPRLKAASDAVVYLITSFLFGLIALLAFQQGYGEFVKNERFLGAYLWPTWITTAMVACGSLLLTLRLLLMALRRLSDFGPARTDPTLDHREAEPSR